MRLLFEQFKLVTEPGGAIAVAAVLSKPQRFRDKDVVAVVSGGNVSPTTFFNAIKLN
jgi:threonine dehydratase